jgi:hypothetical protein
VPALKGSLKSPATTVGALAILRRLWSRPLEQQTVSNFDDPKPPPKRKKRGGRRLKKRGGGSSSGSGELAYTVSRSSGSGEFRSKLSRGGSRSSIGTLWESPNQFASESPSKTHPKTAFHSTGSRGGEAGEPLRPETWTLGSLSSPPINTANAGATGLVNDGVANAQANSPVALEELSPEHKQIIEAYLNRYLNYLCMNRGYFPFPFLSFPKITHHPPIEILPVFQLYQCFEQSCIWHVGMQPHHTQALLKNGSPSDADPITLSIPIFLRSFDPSFNIAI